MKTPRQTSLLAEGVLAAVEPLYESAEASAVAKVDLRPEEPASRLASLLKVFHRLETACRLGRERYRQRRQLIEMDDRELKDIGITREQAEQEARKPIWKG
jgi:uncharacterized protein YjiS (DUF1127 family)